MCYSSNVVNKTKGGRSNMEKVLIEIYVTYGKRSGRELVERYVEEDSKDTRESVLEDWANGYTYIYGNEDSFVEGKEDSLYIDRDGGDWDDPTGVEIVLTTYSKKMGEIESEYNSEISKINKFFGMEDE